MLATREGGPECAREWARIPGWATRTREERAAGWATINRRAAGGASGRVGFASSGPVESWIDTSAIMKAVTAFGRI